MYGACSWPLEWIVLFGVFVHSLLFVCTYGGINRGKMYMKRMGDASDAPTAELLHAFVHTINLLSSLDNRHIHTRFISRNYNARWQRPIAVIMSLPLPTATMMATEPDKFSITFLPIWNVHHAKRLCWHIVFYFSVTLQLPRPLDHSLVLWTIHKPPSHHILPQFNVPETVCDGCTSFF